MDIQERTVADLHAGYLSGALTAVSVTRWYLDRIAAYDRRGPYLNSLISVNAEALATAARLDAQVRAHGTLVGPLHGIPVIVKDNLDTADQPTTSGLAWLRDVVPAHDAFVVTRLRAAGAILLAKASLSELAMGLADSINSVLPGFTRNPYNLAYASGGSSGGTAVAVAANLGAIGVGTDTGGSVRAPASINNLVGIRPTVGLVSRAGMGPLDSQRDTPGPMCRTVMDAARLLDVLAGVDPADPRTAAAAGHVPPSYTDFVDPHGLQGARIGVFRQSLRLREGADPRVVALFEAAVDDLRAAGAQLTEVQVPNFESFPQPPQTPARSRADWETFFASQGPGFPFRTVAELRDAPRQYAVHPLHQARIAEVAAVVARPEVDPETVQGRREEERYRVAFDAAMTGAGVDALVFPVWTHPPVVNGDRGQSPQGPLTFIGSAMQWPVVVVPIGFVGEHLPIGMQILGRPWTEGVLIRFAAGFEHQAPHRQPPPSTPALSD